MSNRTGAEPRGSTQTLFTNDFSHHLNTKAAILTDRAATILRIALSPTRNAVAEATILRIAHWWSRTGSNRRHPACKAGALPAELRPLIVPDRIDRQVTTLRVALLVVGLGGLEPPTSRLSSARSNQLSYKPLDCAFDRLSPTRRTSRKADRPSRLVPRPRGAPGRRPVRRASASQSHSLKKEKRRRQTRFWYARR